MTPTQEKHLAELANNSRVMANQRHADQYTYRLRADVLDAAIAEIARLRSILNDLADKRMVVCTIGEHVPVMQAFTAAVLGKPSPLQPTKKDNDHG